MGGVGKVEEFFGMRGLEGKGWQLEIFKREGKVSEN